MGFHCRFSLHLAAAFSASTLLSGLLAGCGSSAAATPAFPSMAGNWAFTSQATPKTPQTLTLNAGFTPLGAAGSGKVSGIAHLTGAACADPRADLVLSGASDAQGNLTLASQPFAGTTLSLRGKLSADGATLSNATYSFAGGGCASLASGSTTGAQYASISGLYGGTFQDTAGDQIAVTATLTQTTQPDQNGQFHLSGSANFANSSCFASPIVTDSLVTGSALSTTYTSTVNGQTATITANGTFNADASVLTITSWQVAGGLCDGMTGVSSTLTKQG